MFDNGYALLIGVDQNRIADLALPIVKKDVTKLNEVIVHPERCGYAKNHVRVLTGAEATRTNILDGLDWLKESLRADKDANQTAFIYYSGHGHCDETGESFLIPYDFRFPVGTGALAAKGFAEIIQEMSPRRLMVILDCCHAEAMGVKDVAGHSIRAAALTAETPGIAALAKGDGRAILSSSRGDQKSWIRKDEQMSVFTYHLIEALTGHIGRPDEPEVLVTEVMDYVARKVPATAQSEWQADQEPAFQMSGTAFPLALVLGGKGIQKGIAAPDPLAKLPLVIKGRIDVGTVEGEAMVVQAKKMHYGNIDAKAKVGTVKKGGELIGVKIGSLGEDDSTSTRGPSKSKSSAEVVGRDKPYAEFPRSSAMEARSHGSKALPSLEKAAPPQVAPKFALPGLDSEPPDSESATAVRYPSIKLLGDIIPKNEVVLRIDLGRERDSRTDTTGLILDIHSSWTEVPVRVHIVAPDLFFAEGDDQGEIVVLNGRDSIPLQRQVRVAEDLGKRDRIEIRAIFHYNGRMCGSARRAFLIKQARSMPFRVKTNVVVSAAPVAGPASVPARIAIPGALRQWTLGNVVIPESKSKPAPLETTGGTCLLDPTAVPPKLTVEILRVESAPGMFLWHLDCPDQVRLDCKLPARLAGEVKLGMSAGEYVAELFANCERQAPPNHLPFFQGLGEKLWQITPGCFQRTYWSMVDEYGVGFPIQIMSDDPYVPWELMRPIRPDDEGRLREFLGIAHPVARWYMDDEGRCGRRTILPKGLVATTAPDYSSRSDLNPLPAAQAESKAIASKFSKNAISIIGRKADCLRTFQDDANQDICLFHFAGHGGCETTKEDFARICLEDGDLQVFDVRRAETQLGRHRHTLVFFNACQVAQSGLNLGVIGGFAEALMQRDFGGFIAPLWAVYDASAATVSVHFVEEALEKGKPISEVLREIRGKYGVDCPTFLSYLYYGDVMAKFA